MKKQYPLTEQECQVIQECFERTKTKGNSFTVNLLEQTVQKVIKDKRIVDRDDLDRIIKLLITYSVDPSTVEVLGTKKPCSAKKRLQYENRNEDFQRILFLIEDMRLFRKRMERERIKTITR